MVPEGWQHRVHPDGRNSLLIAAAIFDLDGLLIDSEPFWLGAELQVFRGLGAPLRPEDCRQTKGLRIDEVVAKWHHQHPWDAALHPLPDVELRIVELVVDAIRRHGQPMTGVNQVLGFLRSKGLKLGIASSSVLPIITAALDTLGLTGIFDAVCSAEEEEFGKPHPGVYVRAAERLRTVPERCLAFEDSVNGLMAAKAARMRCVLVPDPSHREDSRTALADVRLESLAHFSEKVWIGLNEAVMGVCTRSEKRRTR